MTEQETDLQDPRVLHRAAEHLTDRWAGVFFPELVERCVAECHTDLARQARIPTYLAPMALHGAADRLRALARENEDRGRSVRQVLFVDDDDTGPAAVAAALLAAHAGAAVVTRSAGISPGAARDQHAVRLLAEHGVDPATAAPKPLTDPILSAADWVLGHRLRRPATRAGGRGHPLSVLADTSSPGCRPGPRGHRRARDPGAGPVVEDHRRHRP
jgi:arsenate reductase